MVKKFATLFEKIYLILYIQTKIFHKQIKIMEFDEKLFYESSGRNII